MEGEGLFELVDGELVEKPTMGTYSGEAAGIIYVRLFMHAQANHLGKAYFEVSYRCFPEKPNQLRRPDISFISTSRLAGVPGEGHVPVRPDLAVEVVSPNDGVYELDEKLLDYQSAGIPLVWVVNPQARLIGIHRPGKPIEELRDSGTLDGGEVLPGFSAVVSELLPASVPGNAE
jgi:Uma2 family endonuclease